MFCWDVWKLYRSIDGIYGDSYKWYMFCVCGIVVLQTMPDYQLGLGVIIILYNKKIAALNKKQLKYYRFCLIE